MSTESMNQTVIADDVMTKNSKQDTVWILSLYGTAIGAGTLFLPIDAGSHGLIPLLAMVLLAYPMTFFSHRALSQFVLSSQHSDSDITEVVEEHFGHKIGGLLTFLYFFAIFPILLMYAVAITNTTQSFMVNQLHLGAVPRGVLSLTLIASLMMIARFGQQSIIKCMSLLVYPFIAVLVALSLYLMPHWNMAIFHYRDASTSHFEALKAIWLCLPVMIFSFNHSPIISSFAVSQKSRYGNQAHEACDRLLKQTHKLMIGTVLFFVLSCIFSLSPQDLSLAKQQNISILSYLANHFDAPIIAYLAPVIAFIAIAKSYLGHYLGAREGLQGLMMKAARRHNIHFNHDQLKPIIEIFMVLSCWLVAMLNPNILKMIQTLAGPIIAMILFLMPMYAIATVPALKRFQGALSHRFITVIGLLAVGAIFYGIWESF